MITQAVALSSPISASYARNAWNHEPPFGDPTGSRRLSLIILTETGTPGTMTPLLATKTLAFYDSGFTAEARVIIGLGFCDIHKIQVGL